MHVTEKTFKKEVERINSRFQNVENRLDRVESRLGSVESEVSGLYSFIRDTFDEFYARMVQDADRKIGAILEKNQSDLTVIGEKTDVYRKYCLDEHVELHHQDAKLAERVEKLEIVESKSPSA